MKSFYVFYLKHNMDIMSYGNCVYLNMIFTHNNKSYLINKSTCRKQLNRDVRLLYNLKTKDSILYSELLPAINGFNCAEPKYVVSEKTSRKILSLEGIKYYRYFNIAMCLEGFYCEICDWTALLLCLKSRQLPIINIGF